MKSSVAESRGWPSAVACLIIVLAGAAVYANSLRGPFIFDDAASIVDNPTIRSLSDIWQVLSPPGMGQTVGGRPILNLSFALNYALSGGQVWSWHAANIAVHVLAGLCLFGIVRRTLALSTTAERQIRHATLPALAVALIWTVHPLTTESVTYIVQRAESLVGLWLLLTLYCSIRAWQDPPGTAWKTAAVATCLLGMATKEVMVAAPLLVVLYDWTFLDRTLPGTIQARRRFYVALASTWILLGLLVAGSSSRGGSVGFGQGVGVWEYACTQLGFIVLYLKLCFWPNPLVLDYGEQITDISTRLIPQAMIVVSLVAATMAALCSRRYRPLGFLGACFFCILAPSSSIVPVVSQTGAEHRMYLPLAAVVALVVIGGNHFWNRISTKWRPFWQTTLPLAVLSIAVLALGLLTTRRNADYRSEAAIWGDTVKKCPGNWRAHYSLGSEYYYAGEPEKALESYSRAIALNAQEFGPFQYRGFTYLKLRRFEEAQADFLRALEFNSRDAATHCNLAIARTGAGELEPALASITEAVRLSPENADFRRRRGSLLARLGHHAESLQECSEAVRLEPRSAEGYQLRGRCYQALKRYGAALADFTSAIAINPKQASYVLDRAVVYINLKRYDNARADLAELQRLGTKPDARILDRLTREEAAAGGATPGVDGT